jgi:hypothetical protein
MFQQHSTAVREHFAFVHRFLLGIATPCPGEIPLINGASET